VPGRTVPERIAALLHTVRILLCFGRHLADTIERRAAAPSSFNAIAACFGTAKLSVIIAHLQRGLLRAIALEQVLLARAASGRDIEFVQARVRTSPAPAAPADPPMEQPAASPTERKPAPRPAHRAGRDDDGFYIPTLEELVAQARRRPIGRTIVDICLDLAVVPGFCTGPFWNDLFDIMHCFGGSVVSLMQEKSSREQAFIEEQDRQPGSNWDWMELGREAVRKVLGFFIGEAPVDPFAPSAAPCLAAAAVATGPP
jgi:hypothetical protein